MSLIKLKAPRALVGLSTASTNALERL